MSAGFAQQLEDQKTEVETAEKRAAQVWIRKLAETRSRCELMIAEHRRARVVGRAQHAARSHREEGKETPASHG